MLRSYQLIVVIGCAAIGLTCGSRDPESGGAVRTVVTRSWDTLFVVGADGINDTLFARPHRIAVAGDLIVVGDGQADRVIAIDKRSGEARWSFGRRGSGPTEFLGIADIKWGKDGTILILDYGNGRLAELSTAGAFLGVRSLQHLPAPAVAILPLDDRAIAMSPGGGTQPFMELGRDSLELRGRLSLRWPDLIPDQANTEIVLAEGPQNLWVAAFGQGPGFTVWNGVVSNSHRYIERIPFANRVGPSVRQVGADSARFGAVSLSIVGDEIFMLFGGRPVRSAHPGEPTVWIDTYSLDGSYVRSYRLPSDTDAMATDGNVFYVLVSDGFPALLALRPVLEY